MSPKSFVALLALAAAPALVHAAPQITSAAGATPADIQAAVDAFRAKLGTNNAAAPGPFAGGFRNINWDGVPDGASAPNAMPPTQFIGRGVTFTTPGASVQVSADDANPAAAAVRFGNIDATYATSFKAFSEQRLFAAIGSTIIDTTFTVPSSPATPATTNGFGVVFEDVDLANVSSIEFFAVNGTSLGKYFAPVANNGLSFLGVLYDGGERVARVRVTHGNVPLGAGVLDNGAQDVVATDDFMYGEPLPLATNARFLALSNRARVGAGDDVQIAGFVITGTEPKAVLVRAIGPALVALGVPAPLTNPALSLVASNGTVVGTNDDWGNKPELAQAAVAAGAFPLPANSADAALIAVLAPGAYTLIVSGVGGATGVALAEVYELSLK